VFFGHEYTAQKKHSDAIDRYLDAFCIDSKQPLVSLCLATYLISMAHHPLIKFRHDCLLKGFDYYYYYCLLLLFIIIIIIDY
jgi:hypothetical protein